MNDRRSHPLPCLACQKASNPAWPHGFDRRYLFWRGPQGKQWISREFGMCSLDCFGCVLKMDMACPRQVQGLAPTWIAKSREVRRTPPVLGVSLRTKKCGAMQNVGMCPMPMFLAAKFPPGAQPSWRNRLSALASPKADSTSRWPGAWHSDSQKSVALCENVQIVPNLMFGAVKFPPNGPFEQWDELRTAPPHSRRLQAVAPKGGE